MGEEVVVVEEEGMVVVAGVPVPVPLRVVDVRSGPLILVLEPLVVPPVLAECARNGSSPLHCPPGGGATVAPLYRDTKIFLVVDVSARGMF